MVLTSLVMKYFERIFKDAFFTVVQADLDPLQFAYRSGRGVEDDISTLLNMSLSNLKTAKTPLVVI